MQKENKMFFNNKGFSLIELIMVIAIMVLLIAMLIPRITQYIDKANESVSFTNAQTLCNVAQLAIMDAQSTNADSFYYATKYRVNLNSSDPDEEKIRQKYGDSIKVGRFTNKSLYQYVNGKTSNNKSRDADMTIAKNISESLATNEYYVDCNPIDNRDSTKYISDNKDKYGKFAFALCYNDKGEIIYFESTYKGYFFKMVAGETTIEKVSDDTYFFDWPKYSQRIDSSW